MKSMAAVRAQLCMLGFVWMGAGCSPREERPAPAPRPVAAPQEAAAPGVEPLPKRLFARKYVSKVRQQPSLDAPQLGYLRAGTVLTARSSTPVGHDRCLRGW